MKQEDMVYKVNCLSFDMDSLYHQAAVKLGMSDSVMYVLYLMYEQGGSCLLSYIRKATGISKQTLNSALRRLEKDNIIYLEQNAGRTKTVRLTEKGISYTDLTIGKLYKAECNAFKDWSDEEIKLYLRLMERYNNSLRSQISKI